MTLTSVSFFVFIAVLFVMYYILPRQCQKVLLLFASILFCLLSGGVGMLLAVCFATISTWIGAIKIEKADSIVRKRLVLIVVTVANIGILFLTKYINFFIYTIRIVGDIFHCPSSMNEISIFVPLGLSFFILQAIGYLIDVYRGIIQAQKNFFLYALFSSYFPQLVQGPINRYDDMITSLISPKKFQYYEVMYGLQRIVWGVFKKLVIAERMSVIVNTVYTDYQTYSGLYIVYGTVCFAFQLYADFSGAMDIVLGCSEVLGVKMAENFDTPFISRSISEYWRRWHITLGTWMKDYVFYPLLRSKKFMDIGKEAKRKLGKKRGKNVSTYLGMIILWFTVGLWHGGAWKYIIGSGLLHCFYIVCGQMLQPVFDKVTKILKVNKECFVYRCFEVVRTFALICIGFVFFRADSTRVALQMLRESLRFSTDFFINREQIKMGLDFEDWIIGIIAIILLFFVSLYQNKLHLEGKTLRKTISKQNIIVRWSIYYGLIIATILFGLYGPGYTASQFIYQNF